MYIPGTLNKTINTQKKEDIITGKKHRRLAQNMYITGTLNKTINAQITKLKL